MKSVVSEGWSMIWVLVSLVGMVVTTVAAEPDVVEMSKSGMPAADIIAKMSASLQ